MKIIGNGDKNTYILQCDNKELANLVGYYSSYASGCLNFHIGDEIKISEMYEQLYNLQKANKEINEAKVCLSRVFENLELVKPIISKGLEG